MPEIKETLTRDNPRKGIERSKNSWWEEVDLFKEKSIDFYKIAEKEELERMKIPINTIDWKTVEATAEDVLRSMYMATRSIYDNDNARAFKEDKKMKILLSDGEKFVNCIIHPWSETILWLKAFMASQSVNIGTYENWSPKVNNQFNNNDFDSLSQMEWLRWTYDKLSRERLYKTNDWNIRYYNNPQPPYTLYWERVLYSVGSTQSPFEDLDSMKEKTKIPKSLWETDFFTNYMNAKSETDKVITDPVTWYRYYDPNDKTYDPPISEVSFEWEKHFNLQRFLIDPHFTFFNVPKDTARINALYDIYKYYLVLEKWDREKAWEKSSKIITEYVDPIINSRFEQWMHENYYKVAKAQWDTIDAKKKDARYFVSDLNLYKSDNTTNFPEQILIYNQQVFSGKIKWGRAFSQAEIENLLIEYNIYFRKKSEEESKEIAKKSVTEILERYKQEIESIQAKPVQEYRVLQEWDYPDGFDTRDPMNQMQWSNENPNKVRKVQKSFTEEDRVREMTYLSNFRYAD